ncbi:MAG TPA: sensor histidine kinase KdpD, partial [Anaerolineaceae bacterium]|nr:sensor histidine kinase KdpD [Anaerolineaceae bacterium]
MASKGQLKIFLGYASGVGKTYAMLDAARQLLDEGMDVVVGCTQPPLSEDVKTYLQGMPVIPLRQVGEAYEMNVDAVLERHPRLVVVDELAHTNALGSRHPRRYQ